MLESLKGQVANKKIRQLKLFSNWIFCTRNENLGIHIFASRLYYLIQLDTFNGDVILTLTLVCENIKNRYYKMR